MAKVCLENLLAGVSPAALDTPCSDDHLMELALGLSDWQEVALFLRLEDSEMMEVQEEAKGVRARNLKVLRRWRQKFGEQATYRCLCSVLWKLGRADQVEKVCELLATPPSTLQPAVCKKPLLDSYAEFLKSRYQAHMPMCAIQWPPPPTRKYFNLALIKKNEIEFGPENEELLKLTVRGEVSKVMEKRIPVNLEKIFQIDDAKRKVILIEGAPGSGKSTLSWHICQKWESGELFQQFSLVVYVQLRDQAIQVAQSVADLLPRRNDQMAQDVLSEIEARDGEGVLFVMDGWDELPPELQQQSLFRRLINLPVASSLHRSAVIVTSRPESSAELHSLVSSRIQIVGFTPSEVKEFFTESLKGNSQAVDALMEQMRDSPVIESSCYLPLNVVIIVSVFLSLNDTLPTTLTGLFTSLVLCCILRHIKTKTDLNIKSLSSLDDLPESVRDPFNSLCQLAFRGIMENRVTFSAEELWLDPEFTTLSLLQVTESFVCIGIVGTSRTYSFLHLSIQELLAAWHISKMPHDVQLTLVRDKLGHQQFGEVFQFYAGITKLQTPGIRGILRDTVLNYKVYQYTIFLRLLNCLYEVQDMTQYYLVASELSIEDSPLMFTPYLSPTACLSLGYFLPWLCHVYSGVSKCTLWRIDDRGVELLMSGMRKALSDMQAAGRKTSGGLHMRFSSICHIHETKGIAQMLQSSLFIIHTLDFSYLKLSVSALKCLAESVTRNKSLQMLRVILRPPLEVSQIGPALCEMLEMNRTLQTLWLSCVNGIGGYIARGLMHNSTVTSLSLEYCEVTDRDMESFAAMLTSNTSLKYLDLSGNWFSDTGICHLAIALEYNTTLKELTIDYHYATPNPLLYTTSGLEALAMTFLVNTSLESLKCHVVVEDINERWTPPLESLEFYYSVIGHNQLDELAEKLIDNGVLQQLLKIAIERTVRDYGEEKTSHALYDIIEEWFEEYYEPAESDESDG